MAINRRHHGAPAAWVTDRPDPSAPDGVIKEMLYEPTHRHRYWFLDFRYLVRLDDDSADHWVYSLCVIEGYSRKILAGTATEYQDTVAVLQLLAAAFAEYGRPEGLVSDNGSVFTSDAYEGLLSELGIAVCHIEKGKPWQDLAEAQFKVQLRLADAQFERARGFAEIQERHAARRHTGRTGSERTAYARQSVCLGGCAGKWSIPRPCIGRSDICRSSASSTGAAPSACNASTSTPSTGSPGGACRSSSTTDACISRTGRRCWPATPTGTTGRPTGCAPSSAPNSIAPSTPRPARTMGVRR